MNNLKIHRIPDFEEKYSLETGSEFRILRRRSGEFAIEFISLKAAGRLLILKDFRIVIEQSKEDFCLNKPIKFPGILKEKRNDKGDAAKLYQEIMMLYREARTYLGPLNA